MWESLVPEALAFRSVDLAPNAQPFLIQSEQVITEIGRKVKTLTCFQRHPQYSVPSGDKKVTPEYRQWVNENYDEIWSRVRNSVTAFGFEESESASSCLSLEG